MNRRPSNLLKPLALGTMLAMAFTAAAQQTIMFSKPTQTPEEKADSFLQESPTKLSGRAGEFNAPKKLFNFNQEPSLPPPTAPMMPNQTLKDELNRRKNWTLETPEDILGVPTAEKILGLPDPTGDDKRTPEERYLRRQKLAAGLSSANVLHRLDLAGQRKDANPFAPRDQSDQGDQFGANRQGVGMDGRPDLRPDASSRKYFDRLVNAPAVSPFGASRNANSTWASAFDQPAPLPKPNLDQIASMERFKAMMEPSSPPEKVSVPTRFLTTPLPTTDPNLQHTPLFNPLGASYAPLQSSISRPNGIAPLPTLSTPNYKPVAPKKSLAELPPWLSKDPQPLNGPFNTRTW